MKKMFENQRRSSFFFTTVCTLSRPPNPLHLGLVTLESEDLLEVIRVPVLDGLILGTREQVVRAADEPNALRSFFCYCLFNSCERGSGGAQAGVSSPQIIIIAGTKGKRG